MFGGSLWIWVIFIGFTVISWLISHQLKSRFQKYSKIPTANGMTGRDVVEKMLRDNGVTGVKIGSVEGMLTDHYNPATKTVNLSESVYSSNSVAAAGASAKGVLVSLMLPEAMEEKDLKELMRAVDGACVRYGTAVIGGHTEVTDGVLYPVLTVTAAGGTTRAGLFDPSCVTADLDLVVTKGIALGAVSYLAKTRRDELLTRFSPGFIHGAADFSEDYSVCREAEIAIEHGVAAMQDLSEGGIFGALWEMADGAGIGLDVALKRIPISRRRWRSVSFSG